MIYRYANGQVISPNVIAAIKLTGKIGFLSTQLWQEFFGVGSPRWQERQLQFLVERGLLKKHRNKLTRGYWVLGDQGVRLLNQIKSSCVSPVPVMYLSHDGLVARSLLFLRREKLIEGFNVERELKTYGVKNFLLSDKDGEQKYPDAIFKIKALGEERTVALEYEKEQKSFGRYKSILFQYAAITNLSMALFIVENDAIKAAIKKAMQHLGQTALSDKLAFVTAENWQMNPGEAVISLQNGDVKLRDICTRTAA